MISDNMKYLLTLYLLLISFFTLKSHIFISGNVLEGVTKKCIADVNVIAKNINGKLIGFSSTDENGKFSIKVNEPIDSIYISATRLGYKPFLAKYKLDGNPVAILMEEGALELQEVVVKAERIRENGDTITYNVSSFAQKQDKSIGDVLKRMPGIEVTNSGKIQYQGVDINKFYIEGNDLLGGKYGIATNGISHEDIGAVEVMENHQPMQVLRGLSFSDQAAINLKMKNRAKASFLVHGTLGCGWSEQPKGLLWQSDIFTMIVTGKYQMITTLQGNNSGLNLSDQLTDFSSDLADETMEGYISLFGPSIPNLQRNRTYFNRSWMVSSSHLLKTNKDGEFKSQIDYTKDRVSKYGYSTTTYFLNSGNKVIIDDINSLSHRSVVKGKFSYEANEKSYFLNNTLSANFSWNDLKINTIGSLPNIQTARMPEYSVNNLLKVIKRFSNNKLVTFNSINEWNSLPESLTISQNGKYYGQRINQYSFFTDERASLGFVFNRLLMTIEAGVAGYFRNLDTDLWGIDIMDILNTEVLTTNYLRLFATPKLEWSYKKIEMTLNLPLNLYSYYFSSGLSDRTEFFLSPSIVLRFHLTPRMSLTLRGSVKRSPVPLHDIHDSSILTDYRSFKEGFNDYYTSSGQSLSVSYSYRNAQKGIFLNALGNFGWNHSKFGSVQTIIGDYIFYSYRTQPSVSRSSTTFLNISKTIEIIRGAYGIKGNFNWSENNLLSQGIQTNYRNDSFSLAPFINGNISSFLNWNLKFTWNRSSLKISELPSQRSDNFIFSGNITFIPCPIITWTTSGEFYHNQIDKGRYNDILMLDTKLAFNINKSIEISASVTNILNNKNYSYTTYGNVSQYEYSSRLRGREFMISIYVKK